MGREQDFQQQFMGELSGNLDKLLTQMLDRAMAEGNMFESTIPAAVATIVGFAAKVANDIRIDQVRFVDAAAKAHQRAVAHKAQRR